MSIKEKIKKFLLILKILKEVKKMKEGKNTSEFLVLIVSVIVQIVGGIADKIPASTAALAVTILCGIYIAGRSIVKFTPTKLDDQIIDKIGEAIEKLDGTKPA